MVGAKFLSFYPFTQACRLSNHTLSKSTLLSTLIVLSGVSINYLCRAATITRRTFGLKRLSHALAMGVKSIISQPEGFAMLAQITLKFQSPTLRRLVNK